MTREEMYRELQYIKDRRFNLALSDIMSRTEKVADEILWRREMELQREIEKTSPQPPSQD